MNKAFRSLICIALSLMMIGVVIPQTAYATEYRGFTYKILSDGTASITGYNKGEKNIVVPANINGAAVTEIADNAFDGNEKTESVALPDSVRVIGKEAFYGCKSMRNFYLPKSLTTLGDFAFASCDVLSNIYVTQGNQTFMDIDGVLYGDGGKTIVCCPAGRYGTVNIAEGTEKINRLAFYGCAVLEVVTIPESVTTIGSHAFFGCSGLKELKLPKGINTIPEQAFGYCTSISELIVPGNVNSIGSKAFMSCAGLKRLELPSSVSSIADDAFLNYEKNKTLSELTVYCPSGSYAMDFCKKKGIKTVAYGGTTPTDPVTPVSDKKITRVKGSDRMGMSVNVSKAGWTSSSTVVIANGFKFPDALAGAPLAYSVDAPILLTAGKYLEHPLVNEIQRLGAKKAYILGGTAVVSNTVENTLKKSGLQVVRLWGETRYETAIEIAKELELRSDRRFTDFYFVSGTNYPDALAISSVAALTGNPILYINPKGKIDSKTAKFICGTICRSVTILGGEAAVSLGAEKSIKDYDFSVARLSGEDRYATALAICEFYNTTFKKKEAVAATGGDFPEALVGGALAAHKGSPIVLVNDASASQVSDFLTRRGTERVYIIGDTKAVSSYAESVLQ